MAFPLNSATAPTSAPVAALFDHGANRLAFGRPVQAHERIDKRLRNPDPMPAPLSLIDQKEAEELLARACRAENLVEVERLLLGNRALLASEHYNKLLAECATKGDAELVTRLLAFRKADVENYSVAEGYIESFDSALNSAVQAGCTHVVRSLFEQEGHTSLWVRSGLTPLYMLVIHDSREAVRNLLRAAGPFPYTNGPCGIATPLICAIALGSEQMVQLLLDEGESPDRAAPQTGLSPLAVACKKGDAGKLELLIRYGAKVKGWNSYKTDPLCIAAFNGHTACVQALLAAGSPIVTGPQHGYSALNGAAQNGHAEILQLLLEQGVSANAESTPHGGAPLLAAVNKGHLACMHVLLNAGAEIDYSAESGWTAMCYAALSGQDRALALLLKRCATLNGGSSSHNDPLCIAALHGHRVCVQQLLCADAPIVTGREYGFSALHSAVCKGHTEIVKCLLEQGASVHSESSPDGGSALLGGAVNGQLTCMEILLAAGAKVNHSNNNGCTALYCASAEGHDRAVDLLLEYGAKVNGWRSSQSDPLCAASYFGHLACVQALLAAGASIVTNREHGFNALYYAAKKGHVEIVNYLLQQGTPVDAKSHSGETALMVATSQGQLSCMWALLKAGARADCFRR